MSSKPCGCAACSAAIPPAAFAGSWSQSWWGGGMVRTARIAVQVSALEPGVRLTQVQDLDVAEAGPAGVDPDEQLFRAGAREWALFQGEALQPRAGKLPSPASPGNPL